MQLTIFNGSPKGDKGNTAIISKWVSEKVNIKYDILNLNRLKSHEDYVDKFAKSDYVILIFPLYADSMPGITKAFIEKLESIKGKVNNVKLGFIVHSGSEEACQSRPVEKYLKWLAKNLGANYMGTAILGDGAGIYMMPEKKLKRERSLFNELGESSIIDEKFDEKILKNLVKVEKFTDEEAKKNERIFKSPIGNLMWNIFLIKNRAFRKRYDKPYEIK